MKESFKTVKVNNLYNHKLYSDKKKFVVYIIKLV